MPSVFIDGIEVELAAGERLNGIEAARRAGIEIPHYCWHPGLTVVAILTLLKLTPVIIAILPVVGLGVAVQMWDRVRVMRVHS